MTQLLIDKGAQLDARTRDGLTPMHTAARSGHMNIVQILLNAGASITAKTRVSNEEYLLQFGFFNSLFNFSLER